MAHDRALFAAGCFWGVEAAFRGQDGIVATTVGYSGGQLENPGYEQVCSGTTGHAETVEILFDPDIISYQQLLEIFWQCHDPTQLNRQGPDVGSQYRSAIYYLDEQQENQARQSLTARQALAPAARIVTEITPASAFYRAEEYHQHYLEKRGLSHCGV